MRDSDSVVRSSAVSLAVIAVTSALLVGAQFVLSFVAGVEVVSLLLAVFSTAFGAKRGVAVGGCFALLRCVVFGFVPNVFVAYIIYFPCFALATGLYGRLFKTALNNVQDGKNPVKHTKTTKLILLIVGLTAISVVLTCAFTMLDNLIAPAMMGFSETSARIYLYNSLPTMLTHAVCVGGSVVVAFYPLLKVMEKLKLSMRV